MILKSKKFSAVQEERGPRKQKKLRETKFDSSISQHDILAPTRVHTQQVTQPIEGLQHQILAQILITCIKQARNNEHFRHFARSQQNVILKNVWSECFVLRASHWSIDIGSIVDKYYDFSIRFHSIINTIVSDVRILISNMLSTTQSV